VVASYLEIFKVRLLLKEGLFLRKELLRRLMCNYRFGRTASQFGVLPGYGSSS
jgi:hypothetical protein